MARNIQSDEKQGPNNQDYSTQESYHLGQINSFPDKKKLKEFVNTKPVLQQMLKGFL